MHIVSSSLDWQVMLLLNILAVKASVFNQFPDDTVPANSNESFTDLNVSEDSLSNRSTKRRFSGSDPGLSFLEEMGFTVTSCLLGLQRAAQTPQFL